MGVWMGTTGFWSQGCSQASLDSLCSLHELVKHGKNGLVFKDSEELAAQLQVAVAAPMPGLAGFGGWHQTMLPCSLLSGFWCKAVGGNSGPRGWGSVGSAELGHTPSAVWGYTTQMMHRWAVGGT